MLLRPAPDLFLIIPAAISVMQFWQRFSHILSQQNCHITAMSNQQEAMLCSKSRGVGKHYCVATFFIFCVWFSYQTRAQSSRWQYRSVFSVAHQLLKSCARVEELTVILTFRKPQSKRGCYHCVPAIRLGSQTLMQLDCNNRLIWWLIIGISIKDPGKMCMQDFRPDHGTCGCLSDGLGPTATAYSSSSGCVIGRLWPEGQSGGTQLATSRDRVGF